MLVTTYSVLGGSSVPDHFWQRSRWSNGRGSRGSGKSAVDASTLQALVNEAGRMVPALWQEPITASFAGLRPATQQRDYIIEALSKGKWITVAGIRSTGLTAALGIAEHVTGLVEEHFLRLVPLHNVIWPQVPNLAEHQARGRHSRAKQ